MDDTPQQKNAAAAATRKRRSSILKSQRPPRAPFSELEFNVATPTDTAKSRRVSFSRRTGVAEFVTNEATTTWKNFYEEHNKTLESSGNESEVNPPRRPVGHISKGIFDQQFQEVEAVDLISTLDDGRGCNIETSLNNVNFNNQLASLEYTSDGKLTAPRQNFELSAFTDHQSKMFSDDLAISGMGELSDRISVNFSVVQPIGDTGTDDLDEIQRDLQNTHACQGTNVCTRPFSDGQEVSEYIEVDLNMTNVAIRNEESDMSITDTVHSPKVQDVSKSNLSLPNDKMSLDKDWVADKENILLNPYIAPKESANFAINEEPDKVLVFDGKRLTIQSENEKVPDKPNYRQTLLSGIVSEPTPHRKSIVLNANDDLPNLIDGACVEGISRRISTSYPTIHDVDMSMTQALPSKLNANADKRTSLYNDDIENISMTQALSNIILPGKSDDRRNTIVYNNISADISVTEAVPSNFILSERRSSPERRLSPERRFSSERHFSPEKHFSSERHLSPVKRFSPERRKTIVYEDEAGNISITQAISSKIFLNNAEADKTSTVVFETNTGNVSVTQAVPSNLILPAKSSASSLPEKRKTIVFEDDASDVSFTQAVPSNLIMPVEFETIPKTIVYETSSGDISVTETVPSNILLEYSLGSMPESRKTQVFEDEEGNISITRTVSPNVQFGQECRYSSPEKKNTVPQESDSKDLSITQSMPANIVISCYKSPESNKSNINRTIEQENNPRDVSITQAVPNKIIISCYAPSDGNTDKSLQQNDLSDISATQPVPANIVISCYATSESDTKSEQKSMQENDVKDLSVTQTVPTNVVISCYTTSESNKPQTDRKKSILVNLLDMSNASMEGGGIDDKCTMVDKESEDSLSNTEKSTAHESSDSLFIITKDSEDETQTDENKDVGIETERRNVKIIKRSSNQVDSPGTMKNIQKKLIKIKHKVSDNKKHSRNRYFETVVSSDLQARTNQYQNNDEVAREPLNYASNITFGQADSTKELIEMLSNFTDREEQKDPIELEDKPATIEPKRLTTAPRRASVVISREDLMNSISMAKAVLQQSRTDINDTDNIDETANETIEDRVEKGTQPPKTVRMSNEVVKTLLFDEDSSYSEESTKSETRMSPLRKTAFGEDTYMKESKVNVIPTYLKDVSDGIKQLMNDLVKPMADVMPFESAGVDKGFTKVPSTCSLQVQANLITSSQIDLDPDADPSPDASTGWTSRIVDAAKKAAQMVSWGSDSSATPQSTLSPRKSLLFSKSSHMLVQKPSETAESMSRSDRVLLFDQENPLNNVLFTPIDYSEAHRYDPGSSKSDETLAPRRSRSRVRIMENDKDLDVQRLSAQYILQSVSLPLPMPPAHGLPHLGDERSEQVIASTSVIMGSTESKPMSIDQSIDAPLIDVKSTEVNTLIAMKVNRELLETSSSLTLVDDALVHDDYTDDLESHASNEVKQIASQSSSPVKVIYKINENDQAIKLDSSSPNDDDIQYDNISVDRVIISNKTVKRNHNISKHERHNHCKLSDVDVTPKPIGKIRKIQESPFHMKTLIDVHRAVPEVSKDITTRQIDSKKILKSDLEQSSDEKSKVPPKDRKKSTRKSKNTSRHKKPGTVVTVQQMITGYEATNKSAFGNQVIETVRQHCELKSVSEEPCSEQDASNTECSPDMASSFTSNRLQEDMRSVTTTDSQSLSMRGKTLSMDWQPELINELSSKNLVTECESSVNVVAKIDMLPFMGTRECEWESSGSDSWAFRLLHGRLRLAVRLAHRHDNASRTQVRADTPVVSVALETTHQDKKNAVAVLCVRFAAEAMRYFVGRGCARAGDVPALLRRCAGVARVALRWGRAMHDAYMHLAYTLTNDGYLELKVANIPLRSVWEVTMQIAMVVDDAREVPWPGATDVRVAGVVTDCHVRGEEVRRLLNRVNRDWGNVPRTVWKIFKYLKHKTRDEDMLLVL